MVRRPLDLPMPVGNVSPILHCRLLMRTHLLSLFIRLSLASFEGSGGLEKRGVFDPDDNRPCVRSLCLHECGGQTKSFAWVVV